MMCHDFPNVHALRSVLYDDNYAIIVPGHIEDYKGRNIVCRVVELFDMAKVPEISVLDLP